MIYFLFCLCKFFSYLFSYLFEMPTQKKYRKNVEKTQENIREKLETSLVLGLFCPGNLEVLTQSQFHLKKGTVREKHMLQRNRPRSCVTSDIHEVTELN